MNTSRTSAAQRRRNVGTEQRGPTTSIQSATAFSQPPQIRPGTTGRLAAQQATLAQQQQQQQQQHQQKQSAAGTGAGSQPKMSIPQAITLITLRLGRLESQIQNLDGTQNLENNIDNSVMENILQRMQDLEQKVNENSSIKQQVDIMKPVVASVKNVSSVASKEVKDLKTNIEKLKGDIVNLQTIVSDLQLYMNNDTLIEDDVEIEYIENNELAELVVDEQEEDHDVNEHIASLLIETNSIHTMNLKEIVEQELTLSENN